MRASICREAGATVAANVLFRDLNIITARHDDRRIEVIANSFSSRQTFLQASGRGPSAADYRSQPNPHDQTSNHPEQGSKLTPCGR